MSSNIPLKKSLLSYFVRLLGLFLLLFLLMAFYLGFSNLSTINTEGTSGLHANKFTEDQNSLLVTKAEEDYPAYKSGIRIGDTLTRINNSPVTPDEIKKFYQHIYKIGDRVTFTIRRNGIEQDIEVTLTAQATTEKILGVLFKTIPVLLMLFYIIAGFWGIFKSPYSTETLLTALFCFCFGCFMYATVTTGIEPDNFVRKYLYFDQMKSFISYIMWFGPSFWVLLFATFPRKHSFYTKNRFLSLSFIFLLPAIVTGLLFVESNSTVYVFIIFAMIFLNMWLGIHLLSLNAKRTTSILERRQIRLMLLAIKYGAMSIGIGWLVVLISQFVFNSETKIFFTALFIFLLCQIGGLIIPFAFLNSFFQNKLLETESALRKRIRYVGVTVLLLGAYLTFIFIISRVSVSILDVKDQTFIIIFVLLLSLTFTPLHKFLLRWLDEKFYPERTVYSNSLKRFIQDISVHIEQGDILESLKLWVKNTTGINQILPITFDNQMALSVPFTSLNPNSVLNKIKSGGKFFFWDEVSEKSIEYLNEDETEWAKDNDISLTIPMISQGEVVGLLNVGSKEGEDDFSIEDLDILAQASNQTALALQNIRLQSAYLDKKRMDKELDMARQIQLRLMPQLLPKVTGLDVSGSSKPCYEVAGDYFDIIGLEDGNSVLVIADVSGKGAGAAMIMANLQASIRLGVEISEHLTDFVARINNHVYKNTSPYEFITFFMGIWQPSAGRFSFVNAGHNPPILLDKDNNVTTLDATGLILGVLPNQQYEQGEIKLSEGSTLLIYTDGLEEAMNPQSEIFGTERIIEALKEARHLPPTKIIEYIQSKAIEFCDGRQLHDDLTMIVVKR